MKKFLNEPANAVDEMLDGFCRAHADRVFRVAPRVVGSRARRDGVGLITGGGSGHKPAFIGYLGAGMLDAVAVGDVFTSPPADAIRLAIRAADAGHGVLCLLGNYSGDVMNFRMAADLAAREGIDTALSIATDDVGAGFRDEPDRRRGVTGQVLIWKICGALADRGASLSELTATAIEVNAATRTVGVAIAPCTVPQAGSPTFTLGESEMEFGVGHHGEPGSSREKLPRVDVICERMLTSILDELRPVGAPVAVIVNGLGATPQMELYVAYRRVAELLDKEGIRVHRAWVGEYFTALEMAGFSLTVSVLKEHLAELLDAPSDAVSLRQGLIRVAETDLPRTQHAPATDGEPAGRDDQGASDTDNPEDGRQAAREVLSALAAAMPAERERLCRLDAELGDGDHGVTMAKAFTAVGRMLDAPPGASTAGMLRAVADIFITEVGGATGPLFGSAFLAAADEVPATGPVDSAAIARMLEAAEAAVIKRGGAGPGDKTMLDALAPAARAAKDSAEEEQPVRAALTRASQAAERGAQSTAEMQAKVGRAARLGLRSIGHVDPGAESVALMLAHAARQLLLPQSTEHHAEGQPT
jgi:dihydroxyacetone kinase